MSRSPHATRSFKTPVIALAAALVLGGAWIGAGIEGGRRAEAHLKALTASPKVAQSGWTLRQIRHERGLLGSSGTLEVRLADTCQADSTELLSAVVDYELKHLATPAGLMRVDWNLRPTGDAGSALASALGAQARLQGAGAVSYAGELRSSLALPELTLQGSAGQRLQISPSTGQLSWGDKALGLVWHTDKVVARGNGQAMEMQQLSLNIDLTNRWRGTGHMSLGVERLSTGLGTLEGLKLASQVKENGDRLDMTLSHSLRGTTVAGKVARDLVLELGVKDVHADSLETITRIASESCGLHNITADEGQRLRQAVHTLLAKGFSAGVPRLAGNVDGGTLEGQMKVELRPSQGAIDLARGLQSSGEITLKGAGLTAQQQQFATAMGLAVQVPEGLKASYEYGAGLFKANGRVFDAGPVQMALAQADEQLNRFMAETRLAQARPQVPAAPAALTAPAAPAAPVVPVTPEATTAAAVIVPPAPAVAPAAPTPVVDEQVAVVQACADARACLQQTLRAAARDDQEGVRAVATQIDALAKPDLGNKVLARRLNNEGLEALRRQDAAAAIRAFAQGLKENPRDVELAGNLGFAQLQAGLAQDAVATLTQALVLDARRSSTWTPLAEALALAGRAEEAGAALRVGYQWSGNREKSLAYYTQRADQERGARPALAAVFSQTALWAAASPQPVVAGLSKP